MKIIGEHESSILAKRMLIIIMDRYIIIIIIDGITLMKKFVPATTCVL